MMRPAGRRGPLALAVLLVLAALPVSLARGARAEPRSGSGGGATAQGLPPACPAGSRPPTNPVQPACVHRPWATPYATPVDGTDRVTKSYVVPRIGRPFWDIDVRITYTVSLPTCPKPTPSADIPCQEPGQSVFDYGVFVPGKSQLQPLPPGVSGVVGEPDGTCSASRHSCLMTFYVFPDAFQGRLVMVWGVLVGDLTKNPQGARPSTAGFEFPVVVDIPAAN